MYLKLLSTIRHLLGKVFVTDGTMGLLGVQYCVDEVFEMLSSYLILQISGLTLQKHVQVRSSIVMFWMINRFIVVWCVAAFILMGIKMCDIRRNRFTQHSRIEWN